jgi:tetratricopeptide (TPR) repeat protein
MSRRRIVIAALVGLSGIGGALACGPFFPWQLLSDREATLSDPPVGLGFMSQLKNLVPPPQGTLQAVDHIDDEDARKLEPFHVEEDEAKSDAWRGLVEQPLSENAYLAKLSAARRATTADETLVAGDGLPTAVVEYIAGANAFDDKKFEVALAHFQAIDRLPPQQRRLREVAAAFMEGRTHRELGDFAAARTAFHAAHDRALAGAPDPMGLGVASLGEEARTDLIAAGLTDWKAGLTLSDDAGQLIAQAVRLYAEQAARGSKIGSMSLRDVASMLAWLDSDQLAMMARDLAVRRLLVAYCITNDTDSDWDDAINGTRDDASTTVIAALLSLPNPVAGEDIDRLAMLAYQTGRYDAAEKLTAKTDRALGLWVRAKLALRRGDHAAAIRDWGAAVKATSNDFDAAAKNRMQGELAVAQLSDGQYRQSLDTLFPLARVYWGDVAYIAERVLTVDELKTFVDGLPPDKPKPAKPADTTDTTDTDDVSMVSDPYASIRTLLGRRLIREGRLDEAMAYFPDQKEIATAYRDAVEAAKPTWRWRNVSRAEAMFKVATLTRDQGLELTGTEGPPDEAGLDGNFAYGIGQASPQGDRKTPTNLVSANEAGRFAASAPKPDRRFHYRTIASEQAVAAAELLPHGSQAYAATLCWAARFAKDADDPPRATRIYKLYVATGPYQPWAKTFGGTCPDPDFDAARDYWPKRALHLAKRYPLPAAGVAAVLALLIAGSVVAIRRRRRTT